jgi:hypothetical protein
MSATGAERLTLCGRLAGVRVFSFNPRGTLNSSESLLYNQTAVSCDSCDCTVASSSDVCREAESIWSTQKSLGETETNVVGAAR